MTEKIYTRLKHYTRRTAPVLGEAPSAAAGPRP